MRFSQAQAEHFIDDVDEYIRRFDAHGTRVGRAPLVTRFEPLYKYLSGCNKDQPWAKPMVSRVKRAYLRMINLDLEDFVARFMTVEERKSLA